MTKEQTNRLADFLVEDIMAMTDQEVLLEDTETAAKFAAIVIDNPSYQLSPEFHGDRLSLARGLIALRAQLQADGKTIARLERERNKAQGDADMANDALRCARNELQADPTIPVAAFVDDHVRNAVIILQRERKRADEAIAARDAAITALSVAEAHVAELEAALKPFAEVAQVIASKHPGWDHDAFYWHGFPWKWEFDEDGNWHQGREPAMTLAPFRRARAALRPADKPGMLALAAAEVETP